MNRYRYFDDIRETLERAGLKKRNITTSPLVCLAIGAAAGLLVGVGITMLVAPRSGREMRARISGKAREITQRGRKSLQEVTERGKHAVGEFREGYEQQGAVGAPTETYGQEVIR